MRLSIVTDEISDDLAHALSVCRDLGAKTVELRKVGEQNLVFHDPASLARIRSLLQDGGFQVCSIASPFLKCPLWQEESAREQAQEWQILQRSFEIAHYLEAPLVRTFSFLRVEQPETVRSRVLEVITEATRRTAEAGLKLALENEHACNLATGEETGWLLERLPSPAFGVIWDPGNEAVLGSRPFPAGYQHVRGRIFHLHIKDANRKLAGVRHEERFVKLGTGSIDYVKQFRALAEDGYTGTVSLETHYSSPLGGREQASRESFAALRGILQDAGVIFN